jgi:hypothetical protein
MKSNEFKDWQFSVFFDAVKGIANSHPTKIVTLKGLFEIYKSSYLLNKSKELAQAPEQEKKRIKNMLPYFTASGVYSYRNNASIIEYNSDCLLLDIDNLTQEQAKNLQFKLTLQRGCVLSIISPRLQGVKAIFRLGGAIEINNYRATLEHNINKIAHELNIPELAPNIDANQFNQCQACFISFNEIHFFNEHAEPTSWAIENVEKKVIERPPVIQRNHTATNSETKRIEAYINKYCARVEKELNGLKQGERHANIWRVESVASCLHYAPQLTSEIKVRLLTAVICMYNTEQEAINERAIITFERYWQRAANQSNSVIEEIIKDELEKEAARIKEENEHRVFSINLNSLEQ